VAESKFSGAMLPARPVLQAIVFMVSTGVPDFHRRKFLAQTVFQTDTVHERY
jgi:hypothetical protein